MNQPRCHAPRKRGIQYAAASLLITTASGILDHPLSRAMTVVCGPIKSALMTHYWHVCCIFAAIGERRGFASMTTKIRRREFIAGLEAGLQALLLAPPPTL